MHANFRSIRMYRRGENSSEKSLCTHRPCLTPRSRGFPRERLERSAGQGEARKFCSPRCPQTSSRGFRRGERDPRARYLATRFLATTLASISRSAFPTGRGPNWARSVHPWWVQRVSRKVLEGFPRALASAPRTFLVFFSRNGQHRRGPLKGARCISESSWRNQTKFGVPIVCFLANFLRYKWRALGAWFAFSKTNTANAMRFRGCNKTIFVFFSIVIAKSSYIR